MVHTELKEEKQPQKKQITSCKQNNTLKKTKFSHASKNFESNFVMTLKGKKHNASSSYLHIKLLFTDETFISLGWLENLPLELVLLQLPCRIKHSHLDAFPGKRFVYFNQGFHNFKTILSKKCPI